ncbi:MAG: hypothetical protein HKN25_16505 [Pyrinomonadaceae bacterium]|nr:hypothetical protein [Pyrinomonadaceae bacterium]
MKKKLFSYGTLQKEDVQIELFGRSLNGSSDALVGFKIQTIEIEDEAFLAKGDDRCQQTLVSTQD